MHDPTNEQQAILDCFAHTKQNIIIDARAGCAKTTTLEMLGQCMVAQRDESPVLALAFNVRIKEELEKRFPKNVSVMTMNGLGHRAWGKAIGKRLTLEEKKLGSIITGLFREHDVQGPSELWDSCRRLAQSAMMRGVVPRQFPNKSLLPDSEETYYDIAEAEWLEVTPIIVDIARAAVLENVKQAFSGVISYDDQIYMSALFNGVFPRFPLLLVDEAQDLSPLNHIQVRKAAGERLVVVGDKLQSIYAFRGADTDSFGKLQALRPEETWTHLPLHTTFRCPHKVVERQQEHAPGFVAFPSNEEGRVVHLRGDPNYGEDGWNWRQLEVLIGQLPAKGAPPTIAVICRNNAPLLGMAFRLIRQGVGCKMLGRDIGKGLIVLAKKLVPLDDIPATECARLIEEWRQGQISVLMANGKEEKIAGVEDRAACLQAVIESGAHDAGEVRQRLESLFARNVGQVTLSTIHRVKGFEYDLVLHLDPWRIPSRHAREHAEKGNHALLQQEMNLRYVGETRTKHTLVMASLENFVVA